jgi:two-component system, chemotaxis family, sensor histidine kinase and response regulator PixL
MMHDSEQTVRLQFLDEAQEYLTEIEAAVLGMSTDGIPRAVMNGVLRAAHSIKGGSAMMGFMTLSHLAHQLEDFFKVLKVRPADAKDEDVERLMLAGVDHLRQVANFNREGIEPFEAWLNQTVQPTLESLLNRLGAPQAEDETSLLSEEVGADMVVLLFESEVDSILNRLDEVLEHPEQPCLQAEFAIAAQELAGLGEMLDLPAFRDLCEDVSTQVKTAAPAALFNTITQAQQAWRQAQALVMVGQRDLIPSALGINSSSSTAPTNTATVQTAEMDEIEVAEREAALAIALEWDALELDEPDAVAVELEAIAETFAELPFEASVEGFLDDLQSVALAFNTLEFESLAFEALELETIELEPIETKAIELEPIEIKPIVQELELKAAELLPLSAQAPVKTKIAAATTATTADETEEPDIMLRVPAQQLNQMGELFGELLIERNGLALQLKRMRELTALLTQRVHSLETSNASLRSTYDTVATQTAFKSQSLAPSSVIAAATGYPSAPNSGQGWLSGQAEEFDLLEMDRYSELHTLSQALMESAVQIEEVTTDINLNLDEAEQTARAFTRTTKQLQVSMTQMRMRPVSDVLSRFSRMLRDLGLQHGKSVDLKISGGATLIDRVILETLTDPLVHLVRNAFDHGIEDPQTRIAHGKPAKGLIEISAAYRGNQTLITLRDDGSGISLDKVKAKAAQLGIDNTLLASAQPSEILDLIFEPGFSTASQVTELSGRGVGMDIVRTSLQKIKGSIIVDTQEGRGTTFTISVPFSLSIIRVLLVESGSLLMAVPIDQVEEMLLLDPDKVLQVDGQRVLQLDDALIPLVQTQDLLSFPRPVVQSDLETIPKINQPTILLIEQEGQVVGIQVDRYWGEQEVTVRQVEGVIALPSAFAGCTVLGDGRIAPLLDPMSFLQQIEAQATAQKDDSTDASVGSIHQEIAKQVGTESSTTQPLVMVVDDSVNVRRFLALTLEKAGFRVEQAKDGQHALELLQTGLPIQAVVCDIEMPRLDGYGFLANLKSIPTAQNLPVVMLTSRSGDKHRKLAMSLGAKDYFSKPFRESELLQTLNRLIAQTAVPVLSA